MITDTFAVNVCRVLKNTNKIHYNLWTVQRQPFKIVTSEENKERNLSKKQNMNSQKNIICC